VLALLSISECGHGDVGGIHAVVAKATSIATFATTVAFVVARADKTGLKVKNPAHPAYRRVCLQRSHFPQFAFGQLRAFYDRGPGRTTHQGHRSRERVSVILIYRSKLGGGWYERWSTLAVVSALVTGNQTVRVLRFRQPERRTSMRKSRLLVFSILLVATACAGQARAAASDDTLTPVKLRLNWQMKGEFTPFIVAVEEGFFRAEGLDVKVLEGSSATQALQSVATGQDDLAYVPSVQLIEAVNQGMPLKAIATVVKVDSMAMVSQSAIPLSSPADLQGRTVEISAASTFSQIWLAFAHKNGIDVGKVNVVRVAPGARFSLLLDGKVDVLADIFMTNEYPVLQAKTGHTLNTLKIGDWGFKLLGYTLVAADKLQRDRPDVLKHFNAAAIQGFRFTMGHPVEASAIAVKAYSSVLPVETTKGQVQQLVTYLEQGQPSKLFSGGAEGWQQTLAVLKDSGVIAEQKPLSTYYTNAFVPEP
jgi:NitT/TauT family transport system substrate-binding protein